MPALLHHDQKTPFAWLGTISEDLTAFEDLLR
jgi:hypothetical protein